MPLLTLYGSMISQPTRACRWCMDLLGLDYTFREVNSRKGEHRVGMDCPTNSTAHRSKARKPLTLPNVRVAHAEILSLVVIGSRVP